ncbi:S1C family serine protease [Limobrevibacterium gyesilva]|uniref:S1C family serine protease n=1 Tax=Limobrevibacterium gyesilva TaxID=2991712 RepID=A0AA42CEL9_9PROT|nr:S1C family serine protease [Limobrevibacterium gyesilva]MCW3476208.1 S1C family serine protease [Limobrevibacterium gyesilva]
MTDPLSALSDALQARVRAGAGSVAGLAWGGRLRLSAVIWDNASLVTSEQALTRDEAVTAILPGGACVPAVLAGRDPSTNVAALRLEAGAPAIMRPAEPSGVGAIVLALGSDGAGGATARMATIEVLGPAWDSQAGGRIDLNLRIGARLPDPAEGGPVLDAQGGVLGMSTFGPRRGVMVIPAATIARVLPQLQTAGAVRRGWLGVGVHPVALPAALARQAGAEAGLMVVSLAQDSPAAASLLPGDILLAVAGRKVTSARALAAALGPETVGQSLELNVLRGGIPATPAVTVAERPA